MHQNTGKKNRSWSNIFAILIGTLWRCYLANKKKKCHVLFKLLSYLIVHFIFLVQRSIRSKTSFLFLSQTINVFTCNKCPCFINSPLCMWHTSSRQWNIIYWCLKFYPWLRKLNIISSSVSTSSSVLMITSLSLSRVRCNMCFKRY